MRSDLQPEIFELRTQEQPLVAEHRGGTNSRMKRPQPHPPHTRGTFHRRLQPLDTEKHKVSCSGFLPNTTPMQHSCSHYNAFRSITSQTCTYIRTWQHQMTTVMQPFQCDLQPEIPKHPITMLHTSTPKAAWSHRYNAAKKKANAANRPQPHPPHRRSTFHRRLQPLCTEKHKVSCSGFLPNTTPMQHSCSHYNAFRRITSQTCTYLRTWHHQMTTIMQPFQCDLQAQILKHPTTMHTQAHPKQHEATVPMRQKKGKPTAAAPAAQTKYLSSSAAATLHGKTQGFVLRLPPQNKAHATLMQPLQCILQHSLHHHFPPSPLSIVTPSLPHHFPSSPLPFVTTSLHNHFPLPHHFPSSSLPIVTTSQSHHFPSSPLPFLTTSHRHHFPSSPLPFVTTSLPHHFPSSPLPIVTTSLPHHFPSPPLPFIHNHSPLPHHFPSSPLPHHFPSSPLSFITTSPFLTTSLHHHFPSSPLPFLTTSLRHHFPSSPPCVIASYSFVMYCYVMYHPSSRSIPSGKSHSNSDVLLPNFLW